MSDPVIPICGRIGVIVVRTAANLFIHLFLMTFGLRAEEPRDSTVEVYYRDPRGGAYAGAGGPSLGPTLVPIAIDEVDAKRLAKRMNSGGYGIKPEISPPGYARYTALPQGEYIVELKYGSLNIRNCVAWKRLVVNDEHHKIHLIPQEGITLRKIYVKWDDALPSEIEHAIIQVRRVSDGEVDPYWRQWLHYLPNKPRVERSREEIEAWEAWAEGENTEEDVEASNQGKNGETSGQKNENNRLHGSLQHIEDPEAIEAWVKRKNTEEDVKASNQGKNGQASGRKAENRRLNGSLRYVQVGRTYEFVLFAWKASGQKKFRRRKGLSPVFDFFPQANVPLRYRTRIELKKGQISPLTVVMKEEDNDTTGHPVPQKDANGNENDGSGGGTRE